MELDSAFERSAKRFKRTHRENVGGKITFGYRRGAAVHAAIVNFGAIGRVAPAVARRHYITVRIERHHRTAACVGAAHDQIGDRFKAVALHPRCRNCVGFDRPAQSFEIGSDVLGMRRVVAGRRVGGNAHQAPEQRYLVIEVGVNPRVQRDEMAGTGV